MRRLLFSLVVVLLLIATRATPVSLACTSRAGAVAVVRGACAADAACRFDVDPAPTDALLVDELRLIQPASGAAAADARQYLWPGPALAAWRTGALVTYASEDADTNDPCLLLADPALLAADDLSPALVTVLYSLHVWAVDVADTRGCTDGSEVALRNPTTGVYTCACAPGKICQAGTDPDSSLFWFVAILTVVLALAGLAWSVASGAYALYRTHRLRRALMGSSHNAAAGEGGPGVAVSMVDMETL